MTLESHKHLLISNHTLITQNSGDADERLSSKLKQSSCWVQNMPGTKKYNKINFKCINILLKNIWAKHSQKMLYTLVFFSTGDHEQGLCSVVEFPKLKIIYFTFGPFIDLINGVWLLPAVSSAERHHMDTKRTSVIGHFHQFHNITGKKKTNHQREWISMQFYVKTNRGGVKQSGTEPECIGQSENMQESECCDSAVTQTALLHLYRHCICWSCIYKD